MHQDEGTVVLKSKGVVFRIYIPLASQTSLEVRGFVDAHMKVCFHSPSMSMLSQMLTYLVYQRHLQRRRP
jgi:hypothetical protein